MRMWENSYMTLVVPHFSQQPPVAIVDYEKMVGGRFGGGWLGVRVMCCATCDWINDGRSIQKLRVLIQGH
jgi:hypothetical protein